jgi:hypothetical protein
MLYYNELEFVFLCTSSICRVLFFVVLVYSYCLKYRFIYIYIYIEVLLKHKKLIDLLRF